VRYGDVAGGSAATVPSSRDPLGEAASDNPRDETEAARLDRNYNELLQELRVAENGVQILFAFLLSIAFQQGFKSTTAFQRDVYVFTLICAAIAAAQLIAPVAVHRMIFREHRKAELVRVTSRLALGGLSFLLLALLGAGLLVLDYILNRVVAVSLVAGLAVVFGWLWLALPLRMHHARRSP
jgi:hypothetical protein